MKYELILTTWSDQDSFFSRDIIESNDPDDLLRQLNVAFITINNRQIEKEEEIHKQLEDDDIPF